MHCEFQDIKTGRCMIEDEMRARQGLVMVDFVSHENLQFYSDRHAKSLDGFKQKQ